MIRVLDKPARLSLLEYLFFAGDDRFGALGVSTSAEEYLPRRLGPLPTIADADEIHELVRKVQANEPVPEAQKRLISPGVTMGGARPKALLEIAGEQWGVTFSDGEPADMPVRLAIGHAVAIKRFDRDRAQRLHALSACVALRAAGEPFGYPDLAQLLRRRGLIKRDAYVAQMRELFRRMVFNILLDNTDDHEKNHVLLVTDSQHYELSPAFDILPSGQALGFQQMIVGEAQADSTIANALSLARRFSLGRDDAAEEVRVVARAVDEWKEHFVACGVTRGDVDLYAEQIDRPFLKDQRSQFIR